MINDVFQPITMSEAIKIMAEPLGLDSCDDKDDIKKFVNRYRNLLYNSYRDKKIFDSVFHCFCPQKYPLGCNDPCDKCRQYYWGFTLTEDMGGVVASWKNGESLALRSRWRETHTGVVTKDWAETQLIEVSGRYPTERHLQKSSKLQIIGFFNQDTGKTVKIEGIDCHDNVVTIEFEVDGNGVVCSDKILKEIRSVTLPDLYGHIILAQDDGYELSVYSNRDQRIPNYKRVKVLQGCHNGRILVQATRLFKDLHFDDDIIEVGDALILEEAARYFRYRHSKDTEEIQIANLARAEMFNYLDNLLARDKGRHLQDNPKYGGIDYPHSCFPSSLY